MAALKQWTVTARNLRAEAKLTPGERVEFYATATPPVADVEATVAAIRSLARLSSFEVCDPLPEHLSPTAVIGEARVMLHKPVDPAAEAERISKEIAQRTAEIGKSKAKLANASFVERAPANVVEQERKRLADHEATLAKLQDQLKKLGPRK
jgi:valyl-tRNA synthetase